MSTIKRIMSLLLRAVLCITPWFLRRRLLNWLLGYRFGEGAYISMFSWIYPSELEMGPQAKIGPLNVAIHLQRMVLGEKASIARGNWFTGHPQGSSRHFVHRNDRQPSLYLGQHSAITKSHLIDCTDQVRIGDFTTIAGYRSQFLTHSIDIYANRQDSKPITVGNYCFVGTNCTLLGGSALPDYSVLGAASLLNKAYEKSRALYAGSPAQWVKDIDGDYFRREKGYVE